MKIVGLSKANWAASSLKILRNKKIVYLCSLKFNKIDSGTSQSYSNKTKRRCGSEF